MIRVLSHIADVDDLARELKDMLPVRLQFDRAKPTKDPDKEMWRKLNAHFHAGIVPTFGKHTGLRQDEAKNDLMKMFALVEHHLDDDGNDVYFVEKVGSMNLERLRRLVLEANQFIQETWGDVAEPPLDLDTKEIR